MAAETLQQPAAAETTTQTPPPAPASSDAGPSTGTTLLSEQKDSKPQEKPQSAPERYEFKTPTDGVELGADVLKAFEGVSRELNLSQESAQKVIDKITPAMQASAKQVTQQLRTEWTQALEVDKEFGGDKLQESMTTARRGLSKVETPELRTLLEKTGLDVHPEMVRLFFRVGKALGNDGVVAGVNGDKPVPPKDPVQRLAETFSRME